MLPVYIRQRTAGIMFRLSSRQSVRCPSVDTYSAWRNITRVVMGFQWNLAQTFIVCVGCWKGFQGHGGKDQSNAATAVEILWSIAREPLKNSEEKLSEILIVVGRWNDYVFKVIGSKIKVTETFASSSSSTNFIATHVLNKTSGPLKSQAEVYSSTVRRGRPCC